MYEKLTPQQKVLLVNARWASAETLWEQVKRNTAHNKRVYQNNGEWISDNVALRRRPKVRANRIFRNTESVINALIANPPNINIIPTRDTDEAKELAELQQQYFSKRYKDLNVKEQIRKGLRNLYFSRLIVLKVFWNTTTNDFDVRSIDPLKIRVSPTSTKEEESDFVIEEIEDTITAVCARFPEKKAEILKMNGFETEEEAFIRNPLISYKEAWCGDMMYCIYGAILLSETKNPYWDWDGLKITMEEGVQMQMNRNETLPQIREAQAERQVESNEAEENPQVSSQADMYSYFFNHFNHPRKPYIYATAFNSEQSPIGETDMILQAAPLQESIDRRKQDIDENASLVNGQVKVDSSVMSKADAQKLRFEARGVIWGKGVVQGVQRETGTPLPNFVYEDMVDSRSEVDNIMAATSAFRGEREGQETKAGRLALIDQSYLALNELVQVVDFCCYEVFNWFYQLAKVNYTEKHYAKFMGPDNALKTIALTQDDLEDGTEIKVNEGKTLPEDRQFKYEQAQLDAEKGFLSPADYLREAGYQNATQKAKNAVAFKMNPPIAVGMTPEEIQQLAPPEQKEEVPPSRSISFKDLPIDGQIQLAAQAGLQLNPEILVGEKMQAQRQEQESQAREAERMSASERME
jgi:hypothetical protein